MENSTRDMEGQVCIVTGSSRGIGFYTARGLARQGARVVVVGHNEERGHDAVARIQEDAGEGAAEFMFADLSTQEQIRRFADTFRAGHERLDVLVNNVGGFFLQRQESADGIELTFALNHLSYFLVTNLLLDMLKDSAPARIVNVSSGSHRNARMHFEDLQFEEDYNGLRAYGQSKLANLLFTYELARRLEGTDVTANALHPGLVNTHFGKQNPILRPLLNLIHFLFAKSPKEGAETPIYLASSPEVAGISGQYFVDEEPTRSSDASYDEQAAERLWEISARMVGV